MHLVVGSTGLVGGTICRLMAGRGLATRALVRTGSSPERTAPLAKLSLETVEGDLKDRASIAAALAGVDTVITTASSTASRRGEDSLQSVDLQGQLDLVDAARSAGVRRFVYLSVSTGIAGDSPLMLAKRAVERRVMDSGMTWTVLRPSFFMEVWFSPHLGFDIANGRVRIYGTGESPASWISLADVAAFAVESLSNPAANDAALELGGPEALSAMDVVRMCETMSGRRFEIEKFPEAALQAQKDAATDPMGKTFASLMLACARGDVIDMSRTLEAFPVRLTPVRDHIQRTLAS